MKTILLTASFLILLASCSNQESRLLVLPDETPITGQDYPNDIYINYPICLEYYKDKLLIFLHKNENIIKIIDAKDGKEIKDTGKKGNGPGELTNPDYFGICNNQIYIYDSGRRKIMKYDWDDINYAKDLPIIEGDSIPNKDIGIFSGNIMQNNNLITSIYYGMNEPIAVWDKDLKVINNIRITPEENYKSQSHLSYGGHISSSGNKFAFVMEALGYIACYELQEDGKEHLLWDHFLEKPIYKGDQLDRKHLKLGFPEIKMTQNYIFCSYFGERLTREKLKTLKPRNLLVFDHNGNLLKNLRSARSLGKFCVSDDEKTIYAATEEPEVAIIRFDISDILKK